MHYDVGGVRLQYDDKNHKFTEKVIEFGLWWGSSCVFESAILGNSQEMTIVIEWASIYAACDELLLYLRALSTATIDTTNLCQETY